MKTYIKTQRTYPSIYPIAPTPMVISPLVPGTSPPSSSSPAETKPTEIWTVYQQLNHQENEVMRILEGYSNQKNIEILRDCLKKIENILIKKSDTIRQYMNGEHELPVLLKQPPPEVPLHRPQKPITHIFLSSFSSPREEIPSWLRTGSSGTCLIIEEQPSGNVVANKYLEPAIRVKVSKEYMTLANQATLQVTAGLCGSLNEARIYRTSDGKQNILQGYITLPITPEGYATFNKLKIMDVSSKHHHQPFSIQLQLQEINKTGSVVDIGEPIKTAPLRVQSRLSKKGTPRASMFNHKTIHKKKTRIGDLDCNFIDITPLLVLPQKEAASKLGISESMLCKRFKECTRRKWPYRYLRKIDKMLQMFSPKGEYFTSGTEDQEKIDRLRKEREECLHPVKIRITGNDKVSVKLQSMLTKEGPLSETESEEVPTASSQEDSNFEEDEISQVAETLNSLKQPSPTLSVL